MNIVLVRKYTVDGKFFDNLDTAEVYVEELIYKMLKPHIVAKGFTEAEAYKVFNVVINIRQHISPLLACKFE